MLAAIVQVGFRSENPDKAMVKEVLKEMEHNNIDASQFLEGRACYCQ